MPLSKILVIDDRVDVRLSLVLLFEDAYLKGVDLEADNPQAAHWLFWIRRETAELTASLTVQGF